MKTKQPVSEAEKKQILYLVSHGYGTRKIEQRVDVSRSVVRRVIAEASPDDLKSEHCDGSKLSSFHQIISDKVAMGLTTTRILREIRDLGYSGGRTILAELAAKLRVDHGIIRKPKAKRRFETDPGQEMQLDWSPYKVQINGRLVKIHVLGVMSGYSRKVFFAAFRNERQGTLLDGLSMALEYFEGCALRLVVDNMTTAVLGRREKGQVIWNSGFLDFSKHYGFTPFACAVRDPNRKGKQEKSFRLLEDDFITGSTFSSWDDLCIRLSRWLDNISDVCNNRIHGTTGKVPNEEHLFEKNLFIRLPASRFPTYSEEIRVADMDATISVNGIRYTIPADYAGRNVVVRLYSGHFEVLEKQGGILFSLKYHDTTVSSAKLVIDQTHFSSLARKPRGKEGNRGMQRDFIRRFPQLSELIDGIQLKFKSLLSAHLAILIRLSRQYGDDAFNEAGLYAIKHRRFSADSVKKMLEKRFPERPDQLAPPLDGRGGAILGEVEESDLEEFAILDSYESEDNAE